MPHDAEPVDDEGTAPPVKSGYKPKIVKSKKPSNERTFTNFKVLKTNELNRTSIQATVPTQKTFTQKADEKANYVKNKKVEGMRVKEYDPELEKVPHYMRERVAFLIDQCVNRRTKEYMDEFRRECYQELEDQKKTNHEHIDYYT